jgi:hypothetical protein
MIKNWVMTIFMHIWTIIIPHSRWNVGPPLKRTHNTQLRKKKGNEERDRLDAQHKKELDNLMSLDLLAYSSKLWDPSWEKGHPPNQHLQPIFRRCWQLSPIHQTWGQVEPRRSPNTLRISQLSLHTQWGSLMMLSRPWRSLTRTKW